MRIAKRTLAFVTNNEMKTWHELLEHTFNLVANAHLVQVELDL